MATNQNDEQQFLITASQAALLNKLYRTADKNNPAYMGSAGVLYTEARKQDRSLTKQQVRQWLLGQQSYALAPPMRYRKQREKINVYGVRDLMAADLAEMRSFAKDNDGVNYILVVRNCFTKHVSIGYLREKTARETARVFDYMIATQMKYVCRTLVTDDGKEFLNWEFRAVCAKHGIKMYQPKTGSAVHAENAILMLKTKLYRYIRDTRNLRYLEILPIIVEQYNNSKRSVIGTTPENVNLTNEYAIFQKQYAKHLPRPEMIKAQFKVGDRVRLRVNERTFEKSYFHKYTTRTYIITQVLKISQPPKYMVQALDDPTDVRRVLERNLLLSTTHLLPKIAHQHLFTGIHAPPSRLPKRTYQLRDILPDDSQNAPAEPIVPLALQRTPRIRRQPDRLEVGGGLARQRSPRTRRQTEFYRQQ